MKYILASQSPRRRELLGMLGITFDIEPATGEERQIGDTPQEIVQNLAAAKAREIAAHHAGEESIVIGADTIVVCEGEILGKPKDRADMERMIRMLSGRTQRYTPAWRSTASPEIQRNPTKYGYLPSAPASIFIR